MLPFFIGLTYSVVLNAKKSSIKTGNKHTVLHLVWIAMVPLMMMRLRIGVINFFALALVCNGAGKFNCTMA